MKLILILAFVATPLSYCQSNKPIELFELIKMFIPSEENTFPDWYTGAEEKTPISWETDGTENIPEESFFISLGDNERKGKVILMLNNDPDYKLRKNKEMVEWEIRAIGPRIGISALYVTSTILGGNYLDKDLAEKYFSKKGAKLNLLRCIPDYGSSYAILFYELIVKGKPKIYFTLDYSCGSAGCTNSFLFLFSEPDEEYLQGQGLTDRTCN